MSSQNEPRIPLPKAWNKQVRSSPLYVISLTQFAAAFTRGWGSDSINPRLMQKTESCASPRSSCSMVTAAEAIGHYGSRTVQKYSDEPSWRIRHYLQFSSERLRSMLSGIDRVLTG